MFMFSVDLPPALVRRLKFRARRTRRTLDAEIVSCLQAGVDTVLRREEPFRHAAPRLRRKVGGCLRHRQLSCWIDQGRA